MKIIIALFFATLSLAAAPERKQSRIPFYLIPPAPKKIEAPVFDETVRKQLAAFFRNRAQITRMTSDLINGDEKADFYFYGRQEAFDQAAVIVETFEPEPKK